MFLSALQRVDDFLPCKLQKLETQLSRIERYKSAPGHACIFRFFAGSQKKLQFALLDPNLSVLLVACKKQSSTKELFLAVFHIVKMFTQN